MTTLDRKIRDHLDRYQAFRNRDGHDLAGALRAVLDVEPHASAQARYLSDQKWFHAGQEAYRLQVRRAITEALGITQETPHGG